MATWGAFSAAIRSLLPPHTMLREGSTWRRWDLHLHSPATTLNNQFAGASEDEKWENYIAALEQLGAYGCLGITDYFSIDGFRKVRAFKEQNRLHNVALILPNIELRIVPVTDISKAINIHLLVCPSIVDELEDCLFSNLHMTYKGERYKATQNGITNFGRAFRDDAMLEAGAAYRTGIEQFKIDASQLRDCLTDHPKLRRHALVAVANGHNDGNSGIQDSGLKAVREELYRLSDCIFSGNPNDREYFLGHGVDSPDDVIQHYGSLKPCIHGCDAHTLEKLGKPDKDRHTWIKADTTFEGLHQICHEPDGRVHIGPYAPALPVHRICRTAISLPSETVIRWDQADTPFCFRGSTELTFAAGLTCVIGGRGAGKSTLLNLLHEALAPGTNPYFAEKHARANGAILKLPEQVSVEFLGDQAGIEFISQNQVEEFALEPKRLTKAIFTRIQALDTGALHDASEALSEARATLASMAQLLEQRAVYRSQIKSLRDARKSLRILLTSFGDPEYEATSVALREATQKAKRLVVARQRLSETISGVEVALARIPMPVVGDDECSDNLRTLVDETSAAIAKARSGRDLSKPTLQEQGANTTVEQLRLQLEQFLAARGLSQENLSDVAQASANLANLDSDIADHERHISDITTEMSNLGPDMSTRGGFEAVVLKHLDGLNTTFAQVHKDVKKIELRYRFDQAGAEEALISQLIDRLETQSGKRPRVDHVEQELRRAGDFLSASREELTKAIRASGSKTAESLDAFFGLEPNIEVWEHTRAAIILDVQSYMRLDILYDGHPLDQSSFGQRCSAVLVVLLTLGNTPIVIDEPEAHLDSSIIANYLVELIKRVKCNRQIIFATHNANFVVNGDAELIHVVEMDDQQRSTIRSITIEETSARPLLLALEGGERAFLQREGRYGLAD